MYSNPANEITCVKGIAVIINEAAISQLNDIFCSILLRKVNPRNTKNNAIKLGFPPNSEKAKEI